MARVSSSLWPVSGDAAGILALLREWDAASSPQPLVIETSGSTGAPKRVLLSRDAMRMSALATRERLGGPGRWVLNLPPSYVAGVQVLYRSVIAGTEPIVLDGRPYAAPLKDPGGPGGRRYVSLVPTQLIRLLDDDAEVAALGEYAAVLVGGGPLDPAVRAEAGSRGIRIVQTYGMSETCGGCVYDGVPLPGVEVRVDDDGQVLLRGPVLFDGYQDEPERTAAAYRDGWLVTNDLGRWDGGRLWIDGRVDDVIISGGVKVPAQAVARQLGRGAEVVGVPDREWGERVVAITTEPAGLDALRDRVTPREWAPRQVVVVAEIPRLSNGKPDRVAMRRLAVDA